MQWCLPLKSAMKGYDSEKVIFDCSMLLFNRAMWALDNTKAICDSVTRFGKISPLWQNFKTLWESLEGLFSIWHNCKPTYFGKHLFKVANFHCCKRSKIEK